MFDIVIEDRTKGKQYGFLRHDFDKLFAEFVDRTQKLMTLSFSSLLKCSPRGLPVTVSIAIGAN